jgi:hypothetical protein
MATEMVLVMYESSNGRMRRGTNWAMTLIEKHLMIYLAAPLPFRTTGRLLLSVRVITMALERTLVM